MNVATWIALGFIVWWTALFAVLPFGHRTQEEDDNVTLGTVPSAPSRPRIWRALLITTAITVLVVAAVYGVVEVLGVTFDSLPQMIPG